jgi:pyruvate/2-oxoglutarate dehydrogenase complex dihydrolipoamide dehydrogenase (E3) component
MFRRFGSQVTIVQRRGQVLRREDPDVAEEIANILRQDGIELLLETHPLRVEETSDGHIRLVVRTPEAERTLTGSHLLVAAGRVPNTERLNLAAAEIQTDKRGFIPVNERLETNVPDIYALGDINLLRRLSHHPHQSAGGWEHYHGRPVGALRGLHRPAIGPGGVD